MRPVPNLYLFSASPLKDVFRLTDPLDLDAMRGRVPSDAIAHIPHLPDWTYVLRDELQPWRVVRPYQT